MKNISNALLYLDTIAHVSFINHHKTNVIKLGDNEKTEYIYDCQEKAKIVLTNERLIKYESNLVVSECKLDQITKCEYIDKGLFHWPVLACQLKSGGPVNFGINNHDEILKIIGMINNKKQRTDDNTQTHELLPSDVEDWRKKYVTAESEFIHLVSKQFSQENTNTSKHHQMLVVADSRPALKIVDLKRGTNCPKGNSLNGEDYGVSFVLPKLTRLMIRCECLYFLSQNEKCGSIVHECICLADFVNCRSNDHECVCGMDDPLNQCFAKNHICN